MKKLFVLILAVLMVGVMALNACTSAPPTTAAPTTVPNYPATTTWAPPVTTSASRPPMTTVAPTTIAPPMITRPPTTTSAGGYAPATSVPPYYTTTPAPAATGTIGLATGGAKDIANFRENIRNNFLPLPTDVTYEGLFYDYFFDTGALEPTNKLYSPSYSLAITRDPLSNQAEYYLSVGLNSGLKESDFQRKKLNLVIVIDSSGSMNESYNQYYYDRWGKQVDGWAEEGVYHKNKMQSANDSVIAILEQLRGDDRFAIIRFDSNARVVKPMGLVSQTNMTRVKNDVLNIGAGGSTNLGAGMQLATSQYNNLYEVNSYDYENRIIVLTDAQPNTGDFSASGLLGIAQNNAANRIYTTLIGVGVDFNSDLAENITGIKGANYYSVHSPREFSLRVEDEFDYMVTPLVFNLQLNFQSNGWRIEKVFGSPEADESSGDLMKINTLFASKSEGGENKGGLVLLKLRKLSSNNQPVYLNTTYEDRNGRRDGDSQTININNYQPEYFANSGIRKGILLSRYASLLKNWMIDERSHVNYGGTWEPCVREDTGIIIPVEFTSQWERQSLPLKVSGSYARIFQKFSNYFSAEMRAIGDNTLGQELDVLNWLSRY